MMLFYSLRSLILACTVLVEIVLWLANAFTISAYKYSIQNRLSPVYCSPWNSASSLGIPCRLMLFTWTFWTAIKKINTMCFTGKAPGKLAAYLNPRRWTHGHSLPWTLIHALVTQMVSSSWWVYSLNNYYLLELHPLSALKRTLLISNFDRKFYIVVQAATVIWYPLLMYDMWCLYFPELWYNGAYKFNIEVFVCYFKINIYTYIHNYCQSGRLSYTGFGTEWILV